MDTIKNFEDFHKADDEIENLSEQIELLEQMQIDFFRKEAEKYLIGKIIVRLNGYMYKKICKIDDITPVGDVYAVAVITESWFCNGDECSHREDTYHIIDLMIKRNQIEPIFYGLESFATEEEFSEFMKKYNECENSTI